MNHETEENGYNSRRDNRQIAIISVAILTIVVGFWFLNYATLLHKSQAERATFGDMFGAVNALFSGLGGTNG